MTNTIECKISLKEYFESNGFEVIDMRTKGGCLWVVGSREELAPFLIQVADCYQIQGRFAEGKATRYRFGWYTKSEK